jgi:hypothetical protein
MAAMFNVDRHIAIQAGWIAGPSFGVAMMAAPDYLKLEPFLSGLLFWGGIAVFLLTIIVVLVLSLHEEGKREAMFGRILVMAFCALIFCGGAAWYFWPSHVETQTVDNLGPLSLKDVPVLSATADAKWNNKLLLCNIAPIVGDQTPLWYVSVKISNAMVAKYDRSKPENDQGKIQFSK